MEENDLEIPMGYNTCIDQVCIFVEVKYEKKHMLFK